MGNGITWKRRYTASPWKCAACGGAEGEGDRIKTENGIRAVGRERRERERREKNV